MSPDLPPRPTPESVERAERLVAQYAAISESTRPDMAQDLRTLQAELAHLRASETKLVGALNTTRDSIIHWIASDRRKSLGEILGDIDIAIRAARREMK